MSELVEYKCPNCGGAIEFNSTVQKMKCPYCESEFEMEAVQSHNEELQNEQPDEMNWDNKAGGTWQQGETDGMLIYSCQSCGAQIVGDETAAATSCPYCGNNIVMKEQFAGDLRPDYVIPFKKDKNAAKAALKEHLKGKRLLPKVFKDENHIDEIKGVYVPFWLFDTDTESRFSYKATRVRTWSDANYRYTETKFYSAVRGGNLGFEKVPVDGSTKMDDALMESIEPYDFSEAVDFQTAYLAGYLADKYDVNEENSVARANQRIKQSAEEEFKKTVTGYTSVMKESGHVRLKNGRAKYALYPVWILNTTWQGKNYIFAMNGQTGKMVGDLPMDKGAYWKWHLGLTPVFAVIVYIILLINGLF